MSNQKSDSDDMYLQVPTPIAHYERIRRTTALALEPATSAVAIPTITIRDHRCTDVRAKISEFSRANMQQKHERKSLRHGLDYTQSRRARTSASRRINPYHTNNFGRENNIGSSNSSSRTEKMSYGSDSDKRKMSTT
jgi:hypothetical protein